MPPTAELNPTAASLLGLLTWKPASGWDLVAHIQRTIGAFWNVTRSQVYRELKLLTEAGLIQEAPLGPRDRRPFRLTAAGRQAFERWIAQIPGDIVMRFPLALSMYFGEHIDAAQLAAILEEHRARHSAEIARLRAFAPEVSATDSPHLAEVLRLGIMFHDVILRWIETSPFLTPSSRARPRARAAHRKR